MLTKTMKLNEDSWRVPLWTLSGAANNLFVMVMIFASYVAAGGYGIAVTTAGIIVSSTRIFDAVTDPIFAVVSDKFSTKYGRVRIVLVLGFAIMCLSVLTLFRWALGSGIVVYTVLYMIYIIGYTLYNIAQNLGNPIITRDPKQRMNFGRWRTIVTQIAAVGVTVYMSNILGPRYGGLKLGAFQDLATMAVFVGAVLVFFSCIAISRADTYENCKSGGSDKKIGFTECLKVVKSNNALKWFILAASSDKLALQVASQSAVTTLVFGVVIGNYKFNGNLNLIVLIPSILIIFYATRLKGKGDTKSNMIKWTWIAIALAIVMTLFMAIGDPSQISRNVVYTGIFLVLYCLYTGAKVVTSACTNSMIPDVVDYETYLSKTYMPATVSAVYTFIDKIISSFAATIVSFSIAAVGYQKVMPQPGDTVTSPIFWMTMFLWLGIPVLGWLCTQIAMKYYPLDGEMMKKVQEENSKLRASI